MKNTGSARNLESKKVLSRDESNLVKTNTWTPLLANVNETFLVIKYSICWECCISLSW